MSGTKHRAKGQAFLPCPVYGCVNIYQIYCDIPKASSSNMEQSSSSPATNNAIRGTEQAGNIAKQRFARKVSRLEVSWQQGEGLTIKMGSATYNNSIKTFSIAMIVKVSKVMVIFPEILQGRRTNP